jgi:hypothetical protein
MEEWTKAVDGKRITFTYQEVGKPGTNDRYSRW